jgi:hypothetical protein
MDLFWAKTTKNKKVNDSMTKTCINCKWHHKLSSTYKVCELTKCENGVAIHPETLAVAQDYESYAASLEVKDNFGCIQFEAKQ